MGSHDDASFAWSSVDDDVLTIDTPNRDDHEGGSGADRQQEKIFEEEKQEISGSYYYDEEEDDTGHSNSRTMASGENSPTVLSSNRQQKSAAITSKSTDDAVARTTTTTDPVDNPSSPCCEMHCFGRRAASCWFCFLVIVALFAVAGAAFGGSVLAYYSTQVWNWSWPWDESDGDNDSLSMNNSTTQSPTPAPIQAESSSLPPTLSPTMQPTRTLSIEGRKAIIAARFNDVNQGDGGPAINRAIEWVATQDSANRSVSDQQLIQRIVLASMTDEWPLSTWLTAQHECQWEGVSCDDNETVVGLNLCEQKYLMMYPGSDMTVSTAARSLSSTIPNSMDLLTGLEIVDLSSNQLTGRLPGLSSTSKLSILNVANNSLEGMFPEEMYSLQNMVDFRISYNAVTGNIPGWVDQWTNLKVFDLSFNNLSGFLPTTIGALSVLEVFDASGNRFIGPLPFQLFQLVSLRDLSVGMNQFTGPLSNEVSRLTSLQNLDVSFNMLTGDIPDVLKSSLPIQSLPALTSLNIQGNYFVSNE